MEFELLGAVRFVHNGQEVELRRRQERCLLCILLLENARPVPAYRLLDLLWHGDPPASGRATLHTYVARVRQTLAPHGIGVLRRGDGYLVEVDPDSVDAHRFTGLLHAARAEAGAEPRLDLLERALRLWRGPLLSGVADDRLRQRLGGGLEAARVTALELQARARLSLGRNDEAAHGLAALVAEQPAHERAVELLMTALHRAGRRADALAAFRELRAHLAGQLGLEPSPRLHTLHRSILKGEGPAVVPRELPADLSGFTGRDAALRELDALLPPAAAGAGPVVVCAIAGPPGVGKTALAVHWAHRVAPSFPDGQLYLNLRGYSDAPPVTPAHALTTLLGRLGVPPERVPPDVADAAGLFRSLVAGRRMLVVLDNARSAEQVRPLLPGGPACCVIVTSRDRLSGLVARDGARRVTLDLLSEVDAVRLLGEMVGHARLSGEPSAAATLVRLCGWLPLALRIAGARLIDNPHRTVAELAAEMKAHQALASLDLDGGEGGEGLVAAFDLSYRALPEPARHAFRALGLLGLTDYTAVSVSALAGIPAAEAARALDRLAAAHLLDQHRPGRYAMHDLLWEYAHTLAEPDPHAVARVYDAYVATVSGAARLLYPDVVRLDNGLEPVAFGTQQEANEWLNAERANVTTLIVQAARCGPHAPAWQLADGMLAHFDRNQVGGDRLAASRAAVAAARLHGDDRARAAAYQALAHAAVGPTRPERWVIYLTKAVACAARAGWSHGEAGMRTNLALMFHMTGSPDLAAEHARAAMDLHGRAGTLEARLWAMNILVETCEHLGRPGEGLAVAVEAQQWLDGTASPKARGRVAIARAEMHLLLDEPDAAAEWAAEAVEQFGRLEYRYYAACALLRLVDARLALGEIEAAREAGERALEPVASLENPWLTASAYNTVARIDLALGDPEQALRRRREALRVVESVPNQHELTAIHIGLAEVYDRLGDRQAAHRHAHRALTLSRQSGYPLLEKRVRAVLDR